VGILTSDEIITNTEEAVEKNSGQSYVLQDFSGTYTPKLDEKGRFIIPAKFREVFDNDGVCTITHGLDGCLWLYSKPVWTEVLGNLSRLSDIREGERKLKRFFIGGAKDCELDKQGRILIPPDLREFAKIDGEIRLVGIGNKIEIWAASELGRYDEKPDASPESIAENIDFLTL
jgi:MraZ protein